MSKKEVKKETKEETKKSKFKELWKSPFYNSLFKLVMWALFFLAVIIIGVISSKAGNNIRTNYNIDDNEEETVEVVNYLQMKQNIVSKDQDITYKVKDYYINGKISNNILNATLEDNTDIIYKFKYDNEKLYQIKKNEEVENTKLLSDINLKYLLPKNIMDLIDDPKIIPIKSADEKIYSYTANNVSVSVYLGDKSIEKIIVLDNQVTYTLEYKEAV